MFAQANEAAGSGRTPPPAAGCSITGGRSSDGNFSFMQAGTRSPKAASRQKQIRGKRRIREGATPQLRWNRYIGITEHVHSAALWLKRRAHFAAPPFGCVRFRYARELKVKVSQHVGGRCTCMFSLVVTN